MLQKINHLCKRWQPNYDKNKEKKWKGIAISDDELNRFIEEKKMQAKLKQEVPVYGGTEISKNQQAILQLPPGFTTYEKITETEIETEIEIMMNKARWEQRNKREREGEEWTEELEDQEIEDSTVYDTNKNKLEFRKQRVTELPTCRRIHLPEYEDERFEIHLKILKEEMMDEVKEYIANKCDNKGNIKKTNLTKTEERGLKECLKQNKNEEHVYYMTDKSRTMSVDTPENYIKAMEKHISGDRHITDDELKEIEKKMNGHAIMF